jgi:hypothetical protein
VKNDDGQACRKYRRSAGPGTLADDYAVAKNICSKVIDAVEAIDLREVRVNTRGTGDAQYRLNGPWCAWPTT